MEKVPKSYDDREYMRMAMLKHEETFRQQVYELHRLYQIQKRLMNSEGVKQNQKVHQDSRLLQKQDHDQRDLADEISKRLCSEYQRQQAQRNTDDQVGLRVADHHHQERIAESNNNHSLMLDESEIELTLSLGPSTHNPARRPKTDKSESGQSVSSSSTGSSQTRKTSPKNSSSSAPDQFTWGNSTGNSNTTTAFAHKGPDSDPGFSNGQQNNPPWMFQALSLKLS